MKHGCVGLIGKNCFELISRFVERRDYFSIGWLHQPIHSFRAKFYIFPWNKWKKKLTTDISLKICSYSIYLSPFSQPHGRRSRRCHVGKIFFRVGGWYQARYFLNTCLSTNQRSNLPNGPKLTTYIYISNCSINSLVLSLPIFPMRFDLEQKKLVFLLQCFNFSGGVGSARCGGRPWYRWFRPVIHLFLEILYCGQ